METRYKYPRTPHLPWSKGASLDDIVLSECLMFEDKNIVITEKMDGENTTMYCDHIHARSVDSANHPSRNWVKNFWNTIRHDIPHNMRICGENLYAKHSLGYTNLPSFFLGFSVWIDDKCLSWDETQEWFSLLQIHSVPVLYRGRFNLDKLPIINSEKQEGYVIRNADSFYYSDFNKNVAKYVRAGHVTTEEHWMNSSIVKNILTKQ